LSRLLILRLADMQDGYLCQLSPLIKKLLCSVEKVSTGVIGLCGKALVKLGCVLTPLLSGGE
jgi:hypothetical protein